MTSFEKNLIKWLGTCGTAILGFLAIMVVNDHANISAVLQWQQDYGKKIDTISDTITTHWHASQQANVADTTISIK